MSNSKGQFSHTIERIYFNLFSISKNRYDDFTTLIIHIIIKGRYEGNVTATDQNKKEIVCLHMELDLK